MLSYPKPKKILPHKGLNCGFLLLVNSTLRYPPPCTHMTLFQQSIMLSITLERRRINVKMTLCAYRIFETNIFVWNEAFKLSKELDDPCFSSWETAGRLMISVWLSVKLNTKTRYITGFAVHRILDVEDTFESLEQESNCNVIIVCSPKYCPETPSYSIEPGSSIPGKREISGTGDYNHFKSIGPKPRFWQIWLPQERGWCWSCKWQTIKLFKKCHESAHYCQ